MPESAESKRRRRAADPERFRAQGRKDARKRYYKDPERMRALSKEWRDKNPEKVRAQSRKKYLDNPKQYQAYHFKSKYGLTLDEREAMLLDQGYTCAACGGANPKNKKGWHVDHCHKTGKVRGMLCSPCNLALGHAQDDPDVLRGLVAYLERADAAS